MVSGDGLPHEVYNGLMARPDAEAAVKIPVGIIPGGSADGFARSLCYAAGYAPVLMKFIKNTFDYHPQCLLLSCDFREPYERDPVLACAMNCVRGKVHPLDLFQIETPGQPPLYSCISVGWGILTERDIETEKLRFIGALRFHLWALWRVCRE